MARAAPLSDPDDALVLAFAPAHLAARLRAAQALEAEIEALERPGLEHRVAHIKLAWWHEEAARSAAGRPLHPLTRTLLAEGVEAPALARVLGARLRAAARRIAGVVPPDRASLAQDLADAEGLCGALLGAGLGPRAEACAVALDRARGYARVVVRRAGDARAGRLRLPADALAAAGIDGDGVAAEPCPAALAGVLDELAEAAHAEGRRADGLVEPGFAAALRPALVATALALSTLEARRALRYPATVRAGRLAPLGRLWRAWSCARQLRSGAAPAREAR